MRINRDNIKILLIILVLGLGIGYAYINSDLNINGTAQVNSANWDVHWSNIQVTNGSVSGTNVVTAPSISNGTTVSYSIILNIPGEYYEFTVDAVNAGSIDAMIDTMEFKLNGATIVNPPEYLNYTVTYSDGEQLEENHELKANTTEKYKVRVEYRTDIELNQIPASNQNLLLSFGVIYRQATPAAEEVFHYLYGFGSVKVGDNISTAPNLYSTYSEVLDAKGHKCFTKYKINNNTIVGISAGVIHNNDPIYVIGGGATYNSSTSSYNNDSIYYEQNKENMISIFGSANCSEEIYDTNGYSFYCTDNYASARAYTSGFVSAGAKNDGGWYCLVNERGNSVCAND